MQKQIGQVFNLVFKRLVLKSTRRTCQDPFELNKNIKTDRVCIFRLADGKTKCRPILRYPLKRQKRKKKCATAFDKHLKPGLCCRCRLHLEIIYSFEYGNGNLKYKDRSKTF